MEKTRKKAITFYRCIVILVFLLCLPSTSRAQITELKDDNTAIVHFYVRAASGQARNLNVTYRINGTSHKIQTTIPKDVTFFGNKYFHFTIEAPYDKDNKCLRYPIEFHKGDIYWREGLISNQKSNYYPASFYGDAFMLMELFYVGVSRFDLISLDPEVEEKMMYEFNPETGLSRRLEPNSNGQTIWELNTQDFQHVGNKDYNMAAYPLYPASNEFVQVTKNVGEPYRTEVVLVRKCAYNNHQFIGTSGNYEGGLKQQFGSDADLRGNDVFHACSATDPNKDNDAVTFSTLRENEEQAWPTGCTATRSCVIHSDPLDEDNDDNFGLVGHLRLTLTPKTKKWEAESWVEFYNDPYEKPDGWGTFSTPYDVEVPSGLLVITATTRETDDAEQEDCVILNSMDGCPYIPKNTGVIVKGVGHFHFMAAPDGINMNNVDGVDIVDAYSSNKMQYVALDEINSVPYSCGSGTHYLLTYDDTENKPLFVQATYNSLVLNDGWDDTSTAGHIPPFKSYLCIDGVTYVRELNVSWDDEANAIGSVPVTTTRKTTVHDLAGRSYSGKEHLAPGLYIVNGRKHVIK